MIQWFITNVWPTMFHTLIAAATGAIAAVLVVAPIKQGLHTLTGRIGKAIDSLDPDVPVGLTRQLDSVEAELKHLNTHVSGTLLVHQVRDKDDAPSIPAHHK